MISFDKKYILNRNKEHSETTFTDNQQFIINQDNFTNQIHFSQDTFNVFPNNGSPEIDEKVLLSFGFLEKTQGKIDMSYSADDQQSSFHNSKEGIMLQYKDKISSPQKVFGQDQNYLVNENYRWEVPTKPKILQQDEYISQNNSPMKFDKKIAVKQAILGQKSIDYHKIHIRRSNDKKRQNQLQALQKSNQNSLMQENDSSNNSKQQLLNQKDVENRKLQSNISFYDELQNNQHFIGNISDYSAFLSNETSQQLKISQFNSKSQTPQEQQLYQCIYPQITDINKSQTQIQNLSGQYFNQNHSIHNNNNINSSYIDQNSPNYNNNPRFVIQNNSFQNCNYFEPNFPNLQEDVFQNFAPVNYAYSRVNNMEQYQNGLIINVNDRSNQEKMDQRILEDTNENDEELTEENYFNKENQTNQQVKPQISTGVINGNNQKLVKKSSGFNSKSRRLKKNVAVQLDKSQYSIQNYINSENTKESITDYFKQTNQQADDQLPTFDKYFSKFKSLYNKNIKRRMKISMQRKSYDLASQSKGFSQYHSKENIQFNIERQSSDVTAYPINPRSAYNAKNNFINSGKQANISQQSENQLHIQYQKQLHSPFIHSQQQNMMTPQTIEEQNKFRSDVQQRNVSSAKKSVYERQTPYSINTQQADTNNYIKESSDQLSSIKKKRQAKSLNRRFKCLTEFSEQDIQMTNVSSTKNNTSTHQKHFENSKLNTIVLEDPNNPLGKINYIDHGQEEIRLELKNRKFKTNLHDLELNNIIINMDFNLQNSLSNYVNQKIPLPNNNKMKKFSHFSNPNQQQVGTIQSNSENQAQFLSSKDQFSSSNAIWNPNSIQNDKINSKDQSNITTMQFTNGQSTNTTSIAKLTFQSPKKQITPKSNENGNIQNIQENSGEYMRNNSEVKQKKKVRTQFNFNQAPSQLDIPTIISNLYSKTPQSKVSYNMKDTTNIYLNKQPEPIECVEKVKLQLQKRRVKTPNRLKIFQNENIFKNYKNQNTPDNLLNNINDKSPKYVEQFKNTCKNTTPKNSNITVDVGQSFKLQRNLEQLYLNQNFKHHQFKQKQRTQSEGRKRIQNQRVKTEQNN